MLNIYKFRTVVDVAFITGIIIVKVISVMKYNRNRRKLCVRRRYFFKESSIKGNKRLGS